MLSDDQVKHVAKLARLALSDEEVEKFGTQLSRVLDYMDILGEVNTDNVELTSQVTGLSNVMDKDEIREPQASREELLGCSELPVDSNQIRVKPTIK